MRRNVPRIDLALSLAGSFLQFSYSGNPSYRGAGILNIFRARNLPQISLLLPNRPVWDFPKTSGGAGSRVRYPASMAPRITIFPFSVLTRTKEWPGSSSLISRYHGSPQDMSANSAVPSGQRWHLKGRYFCRKPQDCR